jgi:serine protease Do
MRILIRRVISSLFILLTTISVSHAAAIIDNSLAPMLQKVLPAIVNIRTVIRVTDLNTLMEIQKQQQRRNPNNGDGQQVPDKYTSVASGVIIDANNGYIITNAHPLIDAQVVTVTLADGRHFKAKVIGLDKPSDIALIQIKAKNLTQLALADSNKLKVGDIVAAIGSPFNLSQSVTSGIVSALGRTTLGIENFENFIQTDAPINPGNSGGALVDAQGNLIGINTAILAPSRGSVGIGFAIPSNMAKSIMLQLVEYGDVKRGLLGIGAQDITPDLTSAFNSTAVKGAAVTMVMQDSPAQQSGIQVGDIIVSINGSPIKNASDVVNTVGFLRVNSSVKIDLLRQNKAISTNVALTDPGKRKEKMEQDNPYLFGVGLKDFSALSPIHGNMVGVVVAGVDEDTNAWNADLRPGDVITSANQQKVATIADLKNIAAKADKTLLLNVLRGPSAVFLVINKEQ